MQGQMGQQIPGTDAPARVATLLSDVHLKSHKTLVPQIFEKLRELIVAVQIQPGQPISENEVADALSASKTPVREALIRLEDAGLVNIVPKSGTYVTPISVDRYLEACFCRLLLETGAVRRAAMRTDDKANMQHLSDLLAAQQAAFIAHDDAGFFTLDEDLHRAFFEIAGVPGVWNTVKRLQVDLDRIRHLKRMFGIRRTAQVIDEHRAIITAIQSGSPDAAETALVAHLGPLDAEIEVLSAHPGLLDLIESLNSRHTGPRARRV